MSNPFFEAPILNSPYERPARHWELDAQGQPTQRTVESRRLAEFVTPIPQPRKQKGQAKQQELNLNDGVSPDKQRYAQTTLINDLRLEIQK